MSVRNEQQKTALFSYCCGFAWWRWHTKIKSNCMSSSCLSPLLSSPVSEGDVWVSPAKKEAAFLREKHLQIREGKWSCLIHAHPVSFPSLICSAGFSLLDFRSLTVLRENGEERETEGLERYPCPGWLQITEVICKSLSLVARAWSLIFPPLSSHLLNYGDLQQEKLSAVRSMSRRTFCLGCCWGMLAETGSPGSPPMARVLASV